VIPSSTVSWIATTILAPRRERRVDLQGRAEDGIGQGWRAGGKVYQLTQALRSASNQRWAKLHQFLSDVGVKALRTQLGKTLGIALVSDTEKQYEAYIDRAFGDQPDLFRGR
jgi:hypothetical protein